VVYLRDQTAEIAIVAKIAMPRGSRPGERRGGRKKGTPNKRTALKKEALSAASADPTISPLNFLLGVMRDPKAPTDLRIRVARAAAPLVHAKPGIASPGAGKASAIRETDGFTIDIEEAKALREIEHRLTVFLRRRYAPSGNGGPLTDAEIDEESELDAMLHKMAAALVSPPGYGASER
jgi:hypothetical protein